MAGSLFNGYARLRAKCSDETIFPGMTQTPPCAGSPSDGLARLARQRDEMRGSRWRKNSNVPAVLRGPDRCTCRQKEMLEVLGYTTQLMLTVRSKAASHEPRTLRWSLAEALRMLSDSEVSGAR